MAGQCCVTRSVAAGCGKTTLLSVISGSTTDISSRSRVFGSVLLDGRPHTPSAGRQVALVTQRDFLLPTLTVLECLRYSALLRLPRGTSPAEVQAQVAATVEELGLQKVAQQKVGGSSGIRGISGGESQASCCRRRVTIGMELITRPAILLLDEPTSGLDSFTALKLMHTLKTVAAGGRIVMLSFHQPSPSMFALLDVALVMAQGVVAFQGPPAAAGNFLAARGLPCPEGVALAEHMLHAVSDPASLLQMLSPGQAPSQEDLEQGSAAQPGQKAPATRDLHDPNARSAVQHTPKLADEALQQPTSPQQLPAHQKCSPGASLVQQLHILFWRTLTDVVRNPALLLMHCALSVMMGIFCGLIFMNLGMGIAGTQNRAGALFFSLCVSAFSSLTVVDLFVNERHLVMREVTTGYYQAFPYLLAKCICDALSLRIVPAILFAIPFYPMVNLQGGASHVALYVALLAVFSATVGAQATIIAVGCNTSGKAGLIMNLVLLLSLLFGGFLVNVASIPGWLRWLQYLSIFHYAFQAMLINELQGLLLDFAVHSPLRHAAQ
eukprot:jgi/Astpho2/8052/Aster-03001